MSDTLKAPVMTDVARLAGVSHQTVSRVVNGSQNIRPETRARVLRAIDHLGYRPNSVARALVRGRTGMIGVIRMGGALFGPTSTQASVEAAARDADLFVTSVPVADFTPRALTDAIDHLDRIGVEGAIVIAGHDEALELVRARRTKLPFVVVEGDLSKAQFTVGVDQHAGARAATQHLIDLGHREITLVAGPSDWAESRARREAWRATLVAAGIRPVEPLPGDWSAESGYRAGQQIATMSEVTAVVCANDPMAMGVLRALSEAGIEVPGDISVVGFDDAPEAGYLIPPLTTVRQDFPEVGARAVATLLAAIAGTPIDTPELIRPELVVRASTAPPRQRRR